MIETVESDVCDEYRDMGCKYMTDSFGCVLTLYIDPGTYRCVDGSVVSGPDIKYRVCHKIICEVLPYE